MLLVFDNFTFIQCFKNNIFTSSWNLRWLLMDSNTRKHTLIEAENKDNLSDCSS